MRKLLILTASPKTLNSSRLGKEVRDIRDSLDSSINRNAFLIVEWGAVRPRDLYAAMLKEEPQMVHFAGHGEGEAGLYFEDHGGSPKLVTGEALAILFGLCSQQSQIEFIVLNGCYSSVQAEAIARHIPYVVGMRETIGDSAAIEFSVGFYQAIWQGKSVDVAFEFGKALTALAGTGSTGEPLLVLRESTSISEMNLDQIQRAKEMASPLHESTLTSETIINENAALPTSNGEQQRNILLLSVNQQTEEASHREKEVLVIENSIVRASLAMIVGNLGLPKFKQPIDGSGLNMTQTLEAISVSRPLIIDVAGDEDSLSNFFFDDTDSSSEKGTESCMEELFKTAASHVQCVILNGGYTENSAREIIQHIDFLIGIRQQASQTITTIFLREFYYQIGVGVPIRQAYDQACNKISGDNLDKLSLPILLTEEDEKKRRIIEKKLVSLEKKIEENPESVNLMTSKGELLEKVGEYNQAASVYEKALCIEENDYKVWWKRGKILSALGQHTEAQGPYEKALSLRPSYCDEYVISKEYGLILNILNKPEKSLALYKKSLWIEPKYRAANYEKRKAYKKLYSRNKKKA